MQIFAILILICYNTYKYEKTRYFVIASNGRSAHSSYRSYRAFKGHLMACGRVFGKKGVLKIITIESGDPAELKAMANAIRRIREIDIISKNVKYVNNKTFKIILSVEFNDCRLGNFTFSCNGECGTVDENFKIIEHCPHNRQCSKYNDKIWKRKRSEAISHPSYYKNDLKYNPND